MRYFEEFRSLESTHPQGRSAQGVLDVMLHVWKKARIFLRGLDVESLISESNKIFANRNFQIDWEKFIYFVNFSISISSVKDFCTIIAAPCHRFANFKSKVFFLHGRFFLKFSYHTVYPETSKIQKLYPESVYKNWKNHEVEFTPNINTFDGIN